MKPKVTAKYECECGCKVEFEAIQQATITCDCGKMYDLKIGLYETKHYSECDHHETRIIDAIEYCSICGLII